MNSTASLETNSRIRVRLNQVFDRYPNSVWTSDEELALAQIAKRPEAEIELGEIVVFLNRIKSLPELLTNWASILGGIRGGAPSPAVETTTKSSSDVTMDFSG